MEIYDQQDLPQYTEPEESPDTWGLKNGAEDELLDKIDFKSKCSAVINGDPVATSSREALFLARLILTAPGELLQLARNETTGELGSCGLRGLMSLFGFKSDRVNKVVNGVFSKKNNGNYIIMKEKEGVMKMAKENGNNKGNGNGAFDGFEMKELLAVADEVKVDIVGKSKRESAKVLLDYISELPPQEKLSTETNLWYNVALRLDEGTATTVEEARAEELKALETAKAKKNGKQEEPKAEAKAEAKKDEAKAKKETSQKKTAPEKKEKKAEIKPGKKTRAMVFSDLMHAGGGSKQELIEEMIDQYGGSKSEAEFQVTTFIRLLLTMGFAVKDVKTGSVKLTV